MSENREREERRPGPGPGGPGRGPRGMMEHAKAKDAKGTFKRLLKYISEHIGRALRASRWTIISRWAICRALRGWLASACCFTP